MPVDLPIADLVQWNTSPGLAVEAAVSVPGPAGNYTATFIPIILLVEAFGRVPVGTRRRFFLPLPGMFMARIPCMNIPNVK